MPLRLSEMCLHTKFGDPKPSIVWTRFECFSHTARYCYAVFMVINTSKFPTDSYARKLKKCRQNSPISWRTFNSAAAICTLSVGPLYNRRIFWHKVASHYRSENLAGTFTTQALDLSDRITFRYVGFTYNTVSLSMIVFYSPSGMSALLTAQFPSVWLCFTAHQPGSFGTNG